MTAGPPHSPHRRRSPDCIIALGKALAAWQRPMGAWRLRSGIPRQPRLPAPRRIANTPALDPWPSEELENLTVCRPLSAPGRAPRVPALRAARCEMAEVGLQQRRTCFPRRGRALAAGAERGGEPLAGPRVCVAGLGAAVAAPGKGNPGRARVLGLERTAAGHGVPSPRRRQGTGGGAPGQGEERQAGPRENPGAGAKGVAGFWGLEQVAARVALESSRVGSRAPESPAWVTQAPGRDAAAAHSTTPRSLGFWWGCLMGDEFGRKIKYAIVWALPGAQARCMVSRRKLQEQMEVLFRSLLFALRSCQEGTESGATEGLKS